MAFTDILNLSISASWLVLAVAIARLLLKRAPKALHCALWALVAFRLLCPVSIESAYSLIPSREVVPRDYLLVEPHEEDFSQAATLDIIHNPIYEEQVTIQIEPTVDRVQHWDMMAAILWMAGMGVMVIYAAFSYLSLRLRVRMAAWAGGRIWECDELDSPFILGLFRPRIYLPSELDKATRGHVLAHENAHLKRLDHIWKPLGFALLAVHWFNPVMWLGYRLLCRDIELACDEKVIKKLDKSAIVSYSESLVRCAVPHRSIALCPLAFGEVGVKGRIRAITRYKKPGMVLTVIAVVTAILLAACFVTDPVVPTSAPIESTQDEIEQNDDTKDLVRLNLIYRPEGLPAFISPEFQLCTGEKFVMIEDAFSSYLGYGHYTLEDGELEMRTDDGLYIYVFTEEEDGAFVYDRDRSNNALSYFDPQNPDPRNADYLPHRTRFVLTDCQLLANQRLDAAICAELQKHYCKPDADGRINAVSYQIMDFSMVSGTPLAGTTEHTSRLTVYMAAQCSSYLVNGSSLTEENTEVLNLSMTFLTNENEIELIRILDSNGNKLNQVYSDAALSIWDSRKETAFEILRSQCMERANQQLLYLEGDSQIEALLSSICSSPAQSSNPGAYIAAHQAEYDQLISMGNHTVLHCFMKFAEGDQIGLEGHIMALACREIIGQSEEVYADSAYMTGQEWFHVFARNAAALLHDTDLMEFKSNNPYHAMALEVLGIG